jgi:hypothetical protein
MQELIARADEDKMRRAMERLTALRAAGPEPYAEVEEGVAILLTSRISVLWDLTSRICPITKRISGANL